ncbi:hypothetical protein B296_00000112 [Ensete ventricosum]|uniref:Uncharacterized protein n=1 Tax=Ensete ventricosum TaxID=4639 RepID=A0A427B9U5_ENSVE|nr:hypothetical protein B296_00000112 [Ensete ventricosum]
MGPIGELKFPYIATLQGTHERRRLGPGRWSGGAQSTLDHNESHRSPTNLSIREVESGVPLPDSDLRAGHNRLGGGNDRRPCLGRPTSDRDSASSRKAYARAVVEKRLKEKDEPEIAFEVGEIEYPDHDDALVVSINIVNARVKRVIIDTRSLGDVLYSDII